MELSGIDRHGGFEFAAREFWSLVKPYGVMTVRIFCAFSAAVRAAVFALIVGFVLGIALAVQLAPVPGS
jgi:hypothetical protein